mgnify:FL=1
MFVGIIAEYNPFHNGHAAQLAAARAAGADCIAVAMSAGAVQRGEVPILPESVRVRAALQCGADLVAALPAPYACAGAEAFAAAGVRLLAALGCDTLAFGAETPNAALLMDAAQLLLSEKINDDLHKNLDAGQTFAAARAAAAEAACPGMGALLREPNNILGVEYCKAILTQNAAMTPLPLPRLGTGHGGTTGQHGGVAMASAGYLRTLPVADWAAFVPAEAQTLYLQAKTDGLLRSSVKFDTALLALLRTQTAADFAGVRSVNEGLENRLAAAVRTAADREELYALLKTKRYPHARLRRLALDAALHIPPDLPPLPYIQVLGARKSALPRLKNAALPAGTALADLQRSGAQAVQIGNLHSKMVDFSALCREKTGPMGLAFTMKPVVL